MPALSPRAVRRMGVLQGRLARPMRGFSHPAGHHFMPSDTMNGLILFPELRNHFLPAGLAAACTGVLERWEHRVQPARRVLPTQVIHNDSHTSNVMCNPGGPDEVTGVIDFGDLIRRPLVIDLSTSLTSLVERAPDVVEENADLPPAILGLERLLAVNREHFARSVAKFALP